MSLSRRQFFGAAAGWAAFAVQGGGGGSAAAQESQPAAARGGGPIAIASGNGLGAVAKAVELMRGGADPLDAAVAGVTLVEDDPSDHSVGRGGLPNKDGVVELDASVMHGPTHKAGAVAALQRVRNAAQVAALVMRRTDHVLLVGEGALRFARAHGFKEEELLTDEARKIWLDWKESHSDQDDWLHPEADTEAGARLEKLRKTWPPEGPNFTYGTINCLTLSANGDLAGTTTTSGLSYKLAGRVGDSPIIGAGLYVDNEVGAAGATGRGEASLQNCSSFRIVENMRRGMSPEEACMDALRAVAAKTEKRLRDASGSPVFGLSFYALRKDGAFGGATMLRKSEMAVCDGGAARVIELKALYPAG